jgi:hypothetical protein
LPTIRPYINLLNRGKKTGTSTATCLVGAGNLIACIDHVLNRGFGLQPSGSRVF